MAYELTNNQKIAIRTVLDLYKEQPWKTINEIMVVIEAIISEYPVEVEGETK